MFNIGSIGSNHMTYSRDRIDSCNHMHRFLYCVQNETAWIRTVCWVDFNNLTVQESIYNLST